MSMSTGEKVGIAIVAAAGIGGLGYMLYLKSQYNAYAIASDGSIFVQQTGPNTVIVGLNPSAFSPSGGTPMGGGSLIPFYQVFMVPPSGSEIIFQSTQPYSSAPGSISVSQKEIKGETWLVTSPITIDGPGTYKFQGEMGQWIIFSGGEGMGDAGKTAVVAIDITKT